MDKFSSAELEQLGPNRIRLYGDWVKKSEAGALKFKLRLEAGRGADQEPRALTNNSHLHLHQADEKFDQNFPVILWEVWILMLGLVWAAFSTRDEIY